MTRTANDIGLPTTMQYPPAGWHLMNCTEARKWKAPKTQTPAVMLTLRTPDGVYGIQDPVFVTAKAIQRLNLVAQRLCAMPKDEELPDDNLEAAKELGNYIHVRARGRQAKVLIEVTKEDFVYEDGPKIGQKATKDRHRVAFAGYEQPIDNSKSADDGDVPPDDDIPF